MMAWRAVLVEDDQQQQQFSVEILESAGFEVTSFPDASSALHDIDAWPQPADLCVLDRRLPRTTGEAPEDSVGDELLDAILEAQPGLAMVVFTGHTDLEHAQWTMRNRGSIELQNGALQVDRVAHFEKGQSIEFEDHVRSVASVLSELEDIELLGDAQSENDPVVRRMLRRAGFEYDATCVSAKKLEGGATKASVWICHASGPEGPIASVVLKSVRSRPRPGGLQSLLPATLTAGNLQTISGFCGSDLIAVLQLAGPDPVALAQLALTDPQPAAERLKMLSQTLDEISTGPTVTRTLAEIADPFLSWPEVVAAITDHGSEVPSGTRYATVHNDPQHGDLHPGNVLVVGENLALIDFDSQVRGSRLVDPVAMLLGGLFHSESPLRCETWPSPAQCRQLLEPTFLEGCPSQEFFREAQSWVTRRAASERELWTTILAFAARQLHYPDIESNALYTARAAAIVALAAERLAAT